MYTAAVRTETLMHIFRRRDCCHPPPHPTRPLAENRAETEAVLEVGARHKQSRHIRGLLYVHHVSSLTQSRMSFATIVTLVHLSMIARFRRVMTALAFFSTAYTFNLRPAVTPALSAACTRGPRPAPTTWHQRTTCTSRTPTPTFGNVVPVSHSPTSPIFYPSTVRHVLRKGGTPPR